MDTRFDGKVALVTGGARGIGRSTSILFGQRGAKVVVSDYSVQNGQETVGIIRHAGNDAIFIRTDVRIASEVESLISHITETFGRLDIAFNNAGVRGAWARLCQVTEEDFDQTIDTNLKGVFLCMKYEMSAMKKLKGGVIVNMASAAANRAAEKLSVYSAAKFGVVGLTNAAALEYAKDNIRIVAISPGFIRTPLIERMMEKEDTARKLRNSSPMGRVGEPGEVAELVTWLASDAASYVTGGNILITGGSNL